MGLVVGTNGNDQLTATSDGIDEVRALEGDDRIHVSGTSVHRGRIVTVFGGPGTDTLSLFGGHARGDSTSVTLRSVFTGGLTVVAHHDIEKLEISAESFTGATGDTQDSINVFSGGSFGASDISLNGGNDRIRVMNNIAAIRIDGGSGDDELDVSGSTAPATLLGGDGDDLLRGGAVDDQLFGGSGADRLEGGPGADRLEGGPGPDVLVGGPGDDRYVIDEAGDLMVEDPGGGRDEVLASTSFILAAEFEDLTLTGAGDIYGIGNDGANLITGNSGNNLLSGGAGADTLAGGLGNDTYVVDDAGDVVAELAGEGSDVVEASISYALAANVEHLVLAGSAHINATGNALSNQLYGNDGNNVLDGGAGADSMFGGNGNDVYIVDDVGDSAIELNAAAGIDEVRSSVSFTLGANVENLVLMDAAGNIDGTGNALANVIVGGWGDNRLTGGLGADWLDGQGGSDTHVYLSVADSTAAARDSIRNFFLGDKIDVSAIDANVWTGAEEAFTFIGVNAFTGAAAELRLFQSGAEWIVEADVDGDRIADLVIAVSVADGYVPGASDFIL